MRTAEQIHAQGRENSVRTVLNAAKLRVAKAEAELAAARAGLQAARQKLAKLPGSPKAA